MRMLLPSRRPVSMPCICSFLLLIAALFIPQMASSNSKVRIKVPEVHHLKGYRSPLDKGVPPDYYYGSAEGGPAEVDEDFPEDGMEGLFPNGAGSTGVEEPLCQQECLTKFSEAVKSALQSSNNFERFKGVCQNYNHTVDCMDKLEGERCSNQETFHVFTSGIRYMCIEQRKAFDAVMECVDAQAADVEKECEEVCHVKERLAHWAVQSGILDNFMQGALSSLANGETLASQIFGRSGGFGTLMGLRQQRSTDEAKETAISNNRDTKLLEGAALQQPQGPPLSKRITPDFMRAVVQDGCELTRCQLICVRVKFDAKCGGSAGALLSEAFVRPISQAQEFLTYGHIAPFMGAFLPHQCDFMVKKEVLNEFRIPPELDDVLHRKYNGDKQQQEEEEEGSGERPTDVEEESIGVPTGEPPVKEEEDHQKKRERTAEASTPSSSHQSSTKIHNEGNHSNAPRPPSVGRT